MRRTFTAEEKASVFELWMNGTGFSEIANIKKTCLAQYTQHELDLVAAQLNNRPRKTLKFKTPKEIIERGVALTD